MKRFSIFLLLMIGVAGTASCAAASGSLGMHLGFAKARDAEDGNGLLGGQVELGDSGFLGIQGSVDYRLVESTEIQSNGVHGKLAVRSVPVTVSARLYPLPRSGPSPFIVLGAGWYYILYDYSKNLEALGADDDSEFTFGWHVGGGLSLPLNSTWSVYGEGRAVFVDPDKKPDQELFDDVSGWDYDSSYWAAGLNLHY